MAEFDLAARAAQAEAIAREAGELALRYFRDQAGLDIDRKGHQDFVSQADREVELLIRERLAEVFPEDSIVGEEHAPVSGRSGFTWVIDPIDGTANFISAIPCWAIVLAGVQGDQTRIGVTYDPCHDECFTAIHGQGATRNGIRLHLPTDQVLSDGTTAIGLSARVGTEGLLNTVRGILAEGGIFVRLASGAMSLAYVADGRFLGFAEAHMNAWDCLAGQLLVAEAGGQVEDQDAQAMIRNGGRVVAGQVGVFDTLLRITEASGSGPQ